MITTRCMFIISTVCLPESESLGLSRVPSFIQHLNLFSILSWFPKESQKLPRAGVFWPTQWNLLLIGYPELWSTLFKRIASGSILVRIKHWMMLQQWNQLISCSFRDLVSTNWFSSNFFCSWYWKNAYNQRNNIDAQPRFGQIKKDSSLRSIQCSHRWNRHKTNFQRRSLWPKVSQTIFQTYLVYSESESIKKVLRIGSFDYEPSEIVKQVLFDTKF